MKGELWCSYYKNELAWGKCYS